MVGSVSSCKIQNPLGRGKGISRLQNKKNERKMHEIKQGTPNMIFHMTQKQTEDFFHSSIMHEMKIRNFKLEKKEILPNAIVVH